MADDNDPDNSVVIERSFDAPADVIWQMWTDPEHYADWYGPPGASIPVANMDVCVGGSRLVCMVMETPNGTVSMWFTGEYCEVVTRAHAAGRPSARSLTSPESTPPQRSPPPPDHETRSPPTRTDDRSRPFDDPVAVPAAAGQRVADEVAS